MSVPRTVIDHLERAGLILQADGALPSVASLVAGEAIRGSWWSHPRAHAIYDVCVALGEREDLVSVKLLKGKVTHVARPLWPALVTVGQAHASWQVRGMKGDAVSLLRRVDRDGELPMDRMSWRGKRKPGAVARELEARLLVFSEEFHTAAGRHAKCLMDWRAFGRRHGISPLPSASAAEEVLESAAARLDPRALEALPWR